MTMDDETFGEFLRARRIQAGFGLRAFADVAGLQPSNLSNMEHGRLSPPQDQDALDTLVELLGLDASGRARLFDLAVAGRDRLPVDVARFAAQTPGVPVLLRTIENKGLSSEDLARLTEYVSKRLRKRTT